MEEVAAAVRELKRRAYAMRNGVVADALRRAGAPYRTIFGATLAQLGEIAGGYAPDAGLARTLWADTSLRESVLLAPMLMPPEAMDRDEARRWLAGAPSAEAVDVLCHRLLRRQPYAAQLAEEAAADASPLMRHAAMRLRAYLP